ncbi:acyl-CoA dehydrogenase [Streptomyces axinellae]|uniref:Acyl-CoA oxidase C-terminal domain-containing protein n=1 Tax=Streptomyces axinellae TaxID=552788 RepID=A0ABN3Q582_9ACTN
MTSTAHAPTASGTLPLLPEHIEDPLRTPQGQCVADALGPVRPPEPGEGTPRNETAHHELERLARALPPARELLRDPAWMAALSACSALVDPALYMTLVNHYILCLGSVTASAGERQLRTAELGRVVEELESGHRKGVFLVTEIGDANSHLALRTTAQYDAHSGEFVLRTPDDGALKFSSVGAEGRPQSAVVCARLMVDGICRGVHPFLADLCDEHRTAPGVQISSALGVEALPLEYALVRFDGARLPYDRWLRGKARIDADGCFHDPLGDPDRALQRTLDVGRRLWATVPSAAAAATRASAVAALRHSQHRRSHGRLAPEAPVLAYSTQQRALLGALAEAYALSCASATALDIWQRSEGARTDFAAETSTGGDPAGTADLSGEKTAEKSGENTKKDTGQDGAQESAAGAGPAFSPWAGVDRRLSALKAMAVDGAARSIAECRRRCGLPGYLTVNRLSGYAGFTDAFGAAGGDNRLILLDIGCALADEDAPAGADAALRAADPDDPAWWLRTVSALERRLTARLRAALDERRQQGLDGMELWNPLLERARQLGEVHTLRLAAQSVAEAVRTARNPHPAQGTLAALYGTAQALRLAGPLQWAGVLSCETAAALETAATRQCDRLAPYLDELAGALAPPDWISPTPLEAPDYAAALRSTRTWPDGGRS